MLGMQGCRNITAEFTSDAFLDSGALSCPWYNDVDIIENDAEWSLSFTDDNAVWLVTHWTVLSAVRDIATMGKGHPSMECMQNCLYMYAAGDALDLVDFDAATADEILQMAAFGEIIYG